MSKRFITRSFFIFIALVLLLPAAWTSTARQAHANTGVPYFVDSNPQQGSDSCNGRYSYKVDSNGDCPWASVTPVNTTTFNAGDTIAFAEGGSWYDGLPSITSTFLHPGNGGSGTLSSPIIITQYCNSADTNCSILQPLPLLQGRGDEATVSLNNQQGWTIDHLQITNYPLNQQCMPPFFGLNQSCSYDSRRGVYVSGVDQGVLSGITLSNLDVQDVLGQYGKDPGQDPPQYDAFEITSGIVFDIEKGMQNPSKTNWAHVSVTGNTIYDVLRNGILFHSAWIGDATSGQNCQQFKDVKPGIPNTPSTNITVDHNTVHYLGGNGIIVGVSLNPMLSNNTAYDGDEDKAGGAGIWTFDSNGSTIAHNLVYNWRFYPKPPISNGNAGDAFDTDLCDVAATFEYNFAYGGDGNPNDPNNPGTSNGGFLQAMPQSSGTVVRYNVSQNNGSYKRWFLDNQVNQTGTLGACGAQIYNNDIYMSSQSHTTMLHSIALCGNPTDLATSFENNIIENLGSGSCDLSEAIQDGWNVNYNDFSGAPHTTNCTPPTPPLSNSGADPQLTNPGGADSTTCIPVNTPPTGPTCPAYVLQAGSTIFCLGTQIANNGRVDFDEVTLPTPDQSPNVDPGALEKGAQIC